MQLKRKCKICGNDFTAIKHTQYFCQRKCFKKDYYQRTKAKIAEIESRRPTFNCPVCESVSGLEFDPIRDETSFSGYVCPFCGIPRQTMFEQMNDYRFVLGNSYTVQFVVSSAVVSFTSSRVI